MSEVTPADVVGFWRAAGPQRWFRGGPEFDAEFRSAFLHTHDAAASGRLATWAADAEGALALVLLLDQFPRNAFRGTAQVYATDARAREIADAAIRAGHDTAVDPDLRRFFYLPFMHSEALQDQERSLALNRAMGDADAVRWAEHHLAVVRRFGRFPHRNAILGRTSTPEEERFLAEGGFAG